MKNIPSYYHELVTYVPGVLVLSCNIKLYSNKSICLPQDDLKAATAAPETAGESTASTAATTTANGGADNTASTTSESTTVPRLTIKKIKL